MKKLLFISIILMSFLIACGDSKNEKQNENPDSEDTNDSDIDTVEIYDGDTTPDNPDTTDDVDNPGNTQHDDDPEEPPYGGYCNVKESYGSTSFTRNESSVFDDCVTGSELSFDTCYFDTNDLLTKLQNTTIIFKKDCRENNEPVSCPDFIPDSITLSQISGCDIYHSYGNVECYDECPNFYFPTDNEIFKTVSFHPNADDLTYAEIYSYNEEKGLSFMIDTGEDNIASFKSSDFSVTLSFELWVDGILEEMPHCEDSEGRKYKAGEKISKECYTMECHYSKWYQNGGGGYQCESCAVGLQRQWLCADGVSLVDWCECVKDSESQFGSRFSCIERADLNCPTETESQPE